MSETKRLSIEDFLAQDDEPDVRALADTFAAGAFMNCHCAMFNATGVWIDELVPVFRKLDAELAVSNQRKVDRLVG